MVRNESDVAYAGGGCGYGGFGEGGILGLIALLALFRGNLFGGNHDCARENCCAMENQLANIRADIGDQKYDTVSSIMQQTNTLMLEMCNGKFANAQAVWGLCDKLQCELFGIQKDILLSAKDTDKTIMATSNDTQKAILVQGFENRLSNCEQTNTLSRQIADCCCETQKAIERTAFATQLRDLECCCKTEKQFEEIKCLIKDTAKDSELANLRRESDRNFWTKEIERSTGAAVNATLQSWGANKSFFGHNYPQPPYFYATPV